MKDTQLFSNGEIRDSLFAVASSILTELLYDQLSNSHYEIQNIDQKVVLIQVDEHGLLWKLVFITMLFLSIWALISIVVPRLIGFLDRFRYKNVKKYSTKEVIANYNEVKDDIIRLCNLNSNYFNLLYVDEIAAAINQLYYTFCPQQKQNKRIVISSFRSDSMVDDIGNLISPYEYKILINQAEFLLKIFPTIKGYPMADNDYKILKRRLYELKNIKIA